MTVAVTLKLPLLSRLLLGELAERRGVSDEQLLTDLIRREAVTELERDRVDSVEPCVVTAGQSA